MIEMITFTFDISTVQGCELSEELFLGLSFELMEPKNPLRIFFGAEDFLVLCVFGPQKRTCTPKTKKRRWYGQFFFQIEMHFFE